MRDSLNPAGLTFEEWICAAGVARQDPSDLPDLDDRAWPMVAPYCTSERVSVPDLDSPDRIRVRGFNERYWKIKRYTTKFYSDEIRKAWRGGVDPTEWRANA